MILLIINRVFMQGLQIKAIELGLLPRGTL